MSAAADDVKSIFGRVLELPDLAARAAYLAEVCGDNASLRVELDSLLAAMERAGEFLKDVPAADRRTGAFSPESPTSAILGPAAVLSASFPGKDKQAGAVVAGRYKLLQQIGEGGMGSVWMADQIEPVKRRVAVKLIRVQQGNSRTILSRFEAERQAIALMDHPHIAKLLDAGTTADGSPYFVMELVKGIPLTEFCDVHKLGIRDRLQLFTQVCSAVQHAHQKGIIHRDLKPTNILVESHDGKPMPKVIDFGLAKATSGLQLSENTLFTAFGSVMGTPLYMAPEQATFNAVDVDTRADVYALGVILYELLTGTTPITRESIKVAALDEMLKLIREQEAPTPSSRLSTTESTPSIAANRQMEPQKLGRFVKGELDWIVMKALSKERDRRYETANGFARDIERFLNNEAVAAGPPTVRYKLQKVVARNKARVIAGSMVLLALLLGFAGTTWGLVRAENRRQEADEARTNESEQRAVAETAKKRAEDAEAQTLADYRASTDDAIEQLIGSKPVLGPLERAFLVNTLKRWQGFAEREGSGERGRAIRAEGLFRVGTMHGKLGERADGLACLREAKVLSEKLAAEFPIAPRHRHALAAVCDNLGYLLQETGRLEEAAAEFRQAADIMHKLHDEFPSEPPYRRNLARCYDLLASVLADLGQPAEAEAAVRNALPLQESLVAEFPKDPDYRQALAFSDNLQGIQLRDMGKPQRAEAAYRQALALQGKLAVEFPTVSDYRQKLGMFHHNLGMVLGDLVRLEEADAAEGQSVSTFEQLAADFPSLPEYRHGLATSLNSLGLVRRDQGKSAAAEAAFRQAMKIQAKLAAELPGFPKYRQHLAGSHANLGNLLSSLDMRAEAEAVHRQAVSINEKLVAEFPSAPEYRRALASSHGSLGGLLRGQHRGAEAEAAYLRALGIRKQLAAEFSAFPAHQNELAISHNDLALALRDLGKPSEAEAAYRQSLAIQEKLAADFPALPEYRKREAGIYFNLGLLFPDLGKRKEAEAAYRQALSIQEKLAADFPALPVYRQDLAASHHHLALLLRQLGRGAEAEAALKQALAVRAKLAADFPAMPGHRSALAESLDRLADVFHDLHKDAEAEAARRQALAIRAKLTADFPAMPEYRHDLATCLNNLGVLRFDMGNLGEAEAACREALTGWTKLVADFPTRPEYQEGLAGTNNNLGNALKDLGKPVQAEAAFRQAMSLYEKLLAGSPALHRYRSSLAASQGNLGRLLLAKQQPEQSLEWQAKAVANLESVLRETKDDDTALRFLCGAHESRARVLDDLRRHAEAAADWDRAVELSSKPDRSRLRLLRAQSRVRAGQVEAPVNEAEELSKDANAAALYEAACVLALAAARREDAPGPHSKENCAKRAVEVLRQAVARGFTNAEHMKQDDDLSALRQRNDFQKLLAEMAPGKQPKKQP